MSGEFWFETARLAVSGAIVAAVAAPVGFLAREIVRSRRERLFPPVKPWRVPWGGFELIVPFVVVIALSDILRDTRVPEMASGIVLLFVLLCFLFLWWRVLFPAWSPFERDVITAGTDHSTRSWRRVTAARLVAVAVAVWVVLAPTVLALNMVVTQVCSALDIGVDSHPLTKCGTGLFWERVLFIAEVCVAAPLREEILFRGILLPWVIGGRARNTGGIQLQPLFPPAIRPLVVLIVAAFFAASARDRINPLIFLGVLTLGMAVLWAMVRSHKRHVRAVYATAAFFALVHSNVWPSPIPLFVLGLGLGWLAVRTRGIIAPAIVHGLFNAISAFYVLRSGAL